MIKTPDFVKFILEDTHSRVLRDYIKDLEERINKSIELVQRESFLDFDDVRELLNILGGDSSE